MCKYKTSRNGHDTYERHLTKQLSLQNTMDVEKKRAKQRTKKEYELNRKKEISLRI